MSDPTLSPSDASFDDESVLEPDADLAEETPDPDASAAPADAEMARLNERLLRVTAEYDNYRRRSVTDRQEAVRQGRQTALVPMLEVFDDLTRSLDAARRAAQQDAGSTAFEALSEGVELVHQKFQDALAKVGVEHIEAVGEPFSEDLHEAMMQQPAPEGTASGTVLAEIQPGYRLGDRVLRHARVIVAE